MNRTQAESAFGGIKNLEMPLIDILYADAEMMDSLAAQLEVQEEESEATEAERRPPVRPHHGRADAGLLIDTSDVTPKAAPKPAEAEQQQEVPRITGEGDARIAALLRRLAVPKTRGTVLPSSERSLLVHLDGRLQYYSKRTYEKIMRRETSLRLLLDAPDAAPAAEIATINLETLHLGSPNLAEDDLSGYADTVGGAILAFLPPGPGFFLSLRGNKRPFYVPVLRKNLRCRPKQLGSLFPSFQLGSWKVIAYYPAATKGVSGKSEPEGQVSLMDNMTSLISKQSEIFAACGFPTECLQPILIYRDVAAADT